MKNRKIRLVTSESFVRVIAGWFGLFFSISAGAAPAWHKSTIKQIYPLASGDAVLIFNSDSASCTNANSPKYYYLSIGNNGISDVGFKNIYSAALTAAASVKEVTINFDSATEFCYINRLFVDF